MSHQGSTGEKSVLPSGMHGGDSGNCCSRTRDDPSLTPGDIVAPGHSDTPDHTGYTYGGETVLDGKRGRTLRVRRFFSRDSWDHERAAEALARLLAPKLCKH